MILHLVPDEKVINRTVEVFEKALPNKNTFICLLNSPQAKLVNSNNNVIFYYKDNSNQLPDFSQYNRVIIHLMTYNSIDFCMEHIDPAIPISWIVWGGDIHNQLLAFMGDEYYSSKKFLTPKYRFQMFISKFGIRWGRLNKRVNFLRERVDEYVTEDEYIYTKLKKCLKDNVRKDAVRRDFFYYPISRVLGEHLIGKYASGNNILINHSASITGNHEYIFKVLKNIDLNNRKIVSPLSYNGTKEYADYVKELGYKYFANKFEPLLDFLPLHEYNKLMLSSEICIYGHWRGEAWGNILIALYLGAKVYMSKKSAFIPLLNKLKIKFYILEDINDENFYMPLSEVDKISNRNIIENRYSDMRLQQLIKYNWGNELS